jgi:hypothetical protein
MTIKMMVSCPDCGRKTGDIPTWIQPHRPPSDDACLPENMVQLASVSKRIRNAGRDEEEKFG